jgi:3-methylcrotonyl-CoA carboxylase alpha subunit
MFTRLLIANRGEIACRIMRTARRLGIATVAVYSDADAHALHVRTADEARPIGPAPARESYLHIQRILAAAQACGAQAVHPGYGFLSENGDFAEACEKAGLTFVGPPASAIRAMGSKANAKKLMRKASVPIVPGYWGTRQTPAQLQAEAGKIGYPLLIKASAGGGGKGMRVVEREEEFAAALGACQREAAASFGDDEVLLEKYLTRPRHIEIQIFADRHGNCVHLFERDCSMQRRHQKVLEEAPAPALTEERRRQMGQAAIAAAQAVGYIGAGTVEFIVDQEGRFHFMEMNTRLQVEHPVTELVTGLDLVEWQLRIAAGERLPLGQAQLSIRGHAIEARLYAEDPAKGFLPSTGKLIHLRTPEPSPHIRIDAGVETGDEITPYYDPMIAKLIVWDETREQARQRLALALAACEIVGVSTNVSFLARLVAFPAYAEGKLDTGLIERERTALLSDRDEAPDDAVLVAALALLLGERDEALTQARQDSHPHSPWHRREGWRLNGRASRSVAFRAGETEHAVEVTYRGGSFLLRLGERETAASGEWNGPSRLRVNLGGRRFTATTVAADERITVFIRGQRHCLARVNPFQNAAEETGGPNGLSAPMPGRVVAHLAEAGRAVARGTPLILMESMKMELTIVAPLPGTVRGFPFAVGALVAEGVKLVDFVPQPPSG